MPDVKEKLLTTTLAVEENFKAELVGEGARLGVGWTTALKILARERLAQKKAERQVGAVPVQ